MLLSTVAFLLLNVHILVVHQFTVNTVVIESNMSTLQQPNVNSGFLQYLQHFIYQHDLLENPITMNNTILDVFCLVHTHCPLPIYILHTRMPTYTHTHKQTLAWLNAAIILFQMLCYGLRNTVIAPQSPMLGAVEIPLSV